MIGNLELEILRDGLDDWVPLLAIDGMARQLANSPQEFVIAAVVNLVVNRFVVIGKVVGHRFVVWDGAYEGVESWLRDVYRHRDEREWGFAFWLNNTPLGDERARQSLAGRDVRDEL